MRAALLALTLACVAPAVASGDANGKPGRIVSVNLCTDQLVMLLADRQRIASVSYVASDPAVSAMPGAAAGLGINHGLVEEVVPLDPDLVLTGEFDRRPTTLLLRRLGYRVIELPTAESLAEIRRGVRLLADALGEAERGERLIAELDRRIASLPATPEAPRKLAALLSANLYSWGHGTLGDAALGAAGFDNLAARLAIVGTGVVPLEALIAARPDTVILVRAADARPARATEIFAHPALRRMLEARPAMTLPAHFLVCGTPHIAEALSRLAAFAGRVPATPRP